MTEHPIPFVQFGVFAIMCWVLFAANQAYTDPLPLLPKNE